MSDSILREAPARYGWRTVTLRELCIKGGQYGLSVRANDDDSGIPMLRMGNLGDGQISWSKLRFVKLPESELAKYRLFRGDVIFNRTNSAELVGKTAVFDESREAVFASYLVRFRINPNAADPHFVAAFINSPQGRKFVASKMARAVGQVNVSASAMLGLPIPIPPLSEQRRIMARLKEQMTEAAHARAAAEAQLETINAMIESCLRAAFCGIVPLSIGRDNATPSPGWNWLRLHDVAQLESGHTPSRKRADWWGGDVSWIALPDIRRLDCREVHETSERTNALGVANSSARLLPAGTVCLSRTASVGYVTIMGREMTTSQDFVNWVCGPKLDPWFLLWALRAARKFIRAQSTGAIHQTVYMPVAKAFEVCAPPIAEQRQIAERLREQFAELERARTAATAQVEALKALPAALLREAFKG